MATMRSNVRVIWKGLKDAKTGYLKIAVIKSGKTYIHSLKIKAKKKDFNPLTQRLRAGVKDVDKLNAFIDEKVANYRYLPYQKGKINTMVTFMDKLVKNTFVNGTKEKYENHKHLFILFLEDVYKKSDITFEEFDQDMVAELYKWLLARKRIFKDGSQRVNRTGTANQNIKGYKAMVNKVVKRYNYYVWIQDPFARLILKKYDTTAQSLSADELKKLIKAEVVDTRNFKGNKQKVNLIDVRDAFVFACLAQGLRVSDVMSLRFNNFQDTFEQGINTNTKLIIKKEQLKVKKYVYVSLNMDISRFLEAQVERVGKTVFPDSVLQDVWELFLNYRKERKSLREGYEKEYNYYRDEPYKVEGELDDYALTEAVMDHAYGQNPMLKELYEKYINDLEMIDSQVYYFLVQLIEYLSKNPHTRNKFVFPFLDDKLFSEINDGNDFSLLNEKQYRQFHRKTYLSRLLRKIVHDAGIEKNIHFHCARHTYTTLVLHYDKVGMNLHDLQLSLGHQSLSSTEKYIRKFQNDKIKAINDNLTSHIFEIEPLTKGLKDF